MTSASTRPPASPSCLLTVAAQWRSSPPAWSSARTSASPWTWRHSSCAPTPRESGKLPTWWCSARPLPTASPAPARVRIPRGRADAAAPPHRRVRAAALRLGSVRRPPGPGRDLVAATAGRAVRGAPDRRLRHAAAGARRRDRGTPGGGGAMTMPTNIPALAVIVVRDGELPAGADETVAEAGGAALVLGSGTREAADLLDAASRVWLLERSSVAPGAVAAALAQVLSGVPMVLLPASPDGRDLAPRLAVVLGRALLAGAVRCAPDEVELTRLDDRLSLRVAVDVPVVVTL